MIMIDLNCDLGEGSGCDEQLMPLVTSVNIACGGHAGDEQSMRDAVRLARKFNLNIGAHPSFEDREHFGRKELNLPPVIIQQSISQQVQSLAEIARHEGAKLTHIKPHGALYNMAAREEMLARTIVEVLYSIDPLIRLVCPPKSAMETAAKAAGIHVVRECFIDRSYQSDGSLTPRSQPNAILSPAEGVKQGIAFVLDRQVRCTDGSIIELNADTLCVHGDGLHAVEMLNLFRSTAIRNGIVIRAFQ